MTASGRWCAAAKAAGIAAKVCCHTCRGSGITDYFENGGTLVGQSSVIKSYELQSQNTAASGRTRHALRGRSRVRDSAERKLSKLRVQRTLSRITLSAREQ